ncbi:MAG: chemotaxis response regulator protein-glutamate methylesterase [Gammaproteobacteria bacterium]|nr:MAG: chemotaxis response regulator protein-glutamate methylesterase [Gammaproteobacteria bacterium]
MSKSIKVLIVDDSALIRKMLKEIISHAPDMEVVGTASDPLIAREKIKRLHPDVLTLDIEMPKMDGISFLKKIMSLRPMPVIMISTLTEKGAQVTMDALAIGAFDFIAKPQVNDEAELLDYEQEIVEKIRAAATSNIAKVERSTFRDSKPAATSLYDNFVPYKNFIATIGASTGGTEAIKEVLSALPANCPPIVIAQHIPESFSHSFARRLDLCCAMNVHEAMHGERIKSGNVYIAPGGQHLYVKRDGTGCVCQLSGGVLVNRHRPSVDVLFASVAEVYGRRSCAALLTGMGADGAKGLLQLKQAGAHTMVQDQATSVVWGMPGVAVSMMAHNEQLPLDKVAKSILYQSGKAESGKALLKG